MIIISFKVTKEHYNLQGRALYGHMEVKLIFFPFTTSQR